MLHQHLRNAAVIHGTETTSNEHVTEDEEETTEEKGEQITGLKGGNEQEKTDGGKRDEQHALGFLSLLANGLLLYLDDAFGSTGGNGTDPRHVLVILVRIDEHVFEGVLRKQVGHGPSKHGLARSRVADHQHVASLFGRLLDDDRTGFLSDDLVDQTVGNGNIGGGLKRDLGNPILNRLIENFIRTCGLGRPHRGGGFLGHIGNLLNTGLALIKGFIGRGHGFFGHDTSSPHSPLGVCFSNKSGEGSKRLHH